MFRHPNYYKELRKARNELAKRNAVKEDLACSGSSLARNNSDQVISSCSNSTELAQRAPGLGLKRQAIEESVPHNDIEEASSCKPQAASSKILEPRYMDTEKVFLGKGPRAFTMMKVLCG